MQVFERITRMLRADAHGVMDELEERSLLLKQHLREAELELAHKRAELEAIDEESRRIEDDRQRLEGRIRALDEDVELALAGDHPELARFAVRRLLPIQEAHRELLARACRLEERRSRLSERLEAQEIQLGELRARVRAALARPSAASVDVAVDAAGVSEEEVELELLRRRSTGPSASTDPREAGR